MQEYIHFFLAHWMLSGAFIVIALILIGLELRNHFSGIAKLSPQQTTQAMNHQDALLVDIRPKADFQKGHILNAINIPSAELQKNQSKLEKHKDKPVILVCPMGQQSSNLAFILKSKGFTQVSLLAGGINAWHSAGLPVVKDK